MMTNELYKMMTNMLNKVFPTRYNNITLYRGWKNHKLFWGVAV